MWKRKRKAKLSRSPLGCESFRVAREHGRFPDVVQAQVQHHDALHADAAAGVRWTPEPERLDVGGDLGGVCGGLSDLLVFFFSFSVG